jgi:hypothetical protein
MGIEPISSAWKAENLPLIYIRVFSLLVGYSEAMRALWMGTFIMTATAPYISNVRSRFIM